mgnify:CR=1 FL=1
MAKKTTAGAGKIPQKKKSFKDVCKENIGFFFILPWLFGFLAFKFYPMASSLFYSLQIITCSRDSMKLEHSRTILMYSQQERS